MKNVAVFGLIMALTLGVFCPLFAADSAGTGWEKLFPDGLIDGEGNPVDLDVLKGKMVGLYFSAHWCPPCRQFSPQLVSFRDANQSDFEIVFVTSDKDEKAQFEYMKELGMKWPTLKFGSEAINNIKGKYGVQSIPTLIILSPDGETVSQNGRMDVSESPDSCLAAWKAKVVKK